MRFAGRSAAVPAACGVVLALAAGCGQDPTPAPTAIGEPTSVAVQAPSATTATPSSTATPTSTADLTTVSAGPDPVLGAPPDGTTAVPAAQVDATALPPGFPATVWTRGTRTVGLYGPAGGCTDVDARVTGQDDRQVVLAVVQTSTGADACTRELRYRPLELPLEADLGTRRVVLTGTAAG